MNKKRSTMFSVAKGALAIFVSLLVAAVLVFVSAAGDTVADKFAETGIALKSMLVSPLFKADGSFNFKGLCDVLALMIPIMFTGVGTCIMFSANQFNLGSEGGIMLGAFVTACVAVYAPIKGVLLPIVAILAGGIATAIVLYIPATLKAHFGVSEMVNSLMLNSIIQYTIMFLLNMYLADTTKGQVQMLPIQENAALPQIINNGSKFHVGFIIAIVVVALAWIFMYRTKWGYSIRMIGINQDFSKYSGLNVVKIIILAQVLGGFIAGIGGGAEMLGRYTAYNWKTLPGYGWTGVTVAILAGNNPLFVPFAAFFISYLNKGCTLMATYTSIPSQLIDIIQAVLFILFAADKFLSRYKQKLVVKSAEEEAAIKRQTELEFRGGEK